jgi:hypothetical protein
MVPALQTVNLVATKVIFLSHSLAEVLARRLVGNRKPDPPKARINMPRS